MSLSNATRNVNKIKLEEGLNILEHFLTANKMAIHRIKNIND